MERIGLIEFRNVSVGMAVYVDKLRQWPTNIRCFKAGSCHLIADSEGELLAFAKRIGLRGEWLQPATRSRCAHFDLTVGKRGMALVLGAVELDDREFMDKMRLEVGS